MEVRKGNQMKTRRLCYPPEGQIASLEGRAIVELFYRGLAAPGMESATIWSLSALIFASMN